jgi:hypothetical protein
VSLTTEVAEADGIPISELGCQTQNGRKPFVGLCNAILQLRKSVDKYSSKGRKKAVERFTNGHGLGILLVITGISGRAPIC